MFVYLFMCFVWKVCGHTFGVYDNKVEVLASLYTCAFFIRALRDPTATNIAMNIPAGCDHAISTGVDVLLWLPMTPRPLNPL